MDSDIFIIVNDCNNLIHLNILAGIISQSASIEKMKFLIYVLILLDFNFISDLLKIIIKDY